MKKFHSIYRQASAKIRFGGIWEDMALPPAPSEAIKDLSWIELSFS
jgi:hypothetical protein